VCRLKYVDTRRRSRERQGYIRSEREDSSISVLSSRKDSRHPTPPRLSTSQDAQFSRTMRFAAQQNETKSKGGTRKLQGGEIERSERKDTKSVIAVVVVVMSNGVGTSMWGKSMYEGKGVEGKCEGTLSCIGRIDRGIGLTCGRRVGLITRDSVRGGRRPREMRVDDSMNVRCDAVLRQSRSIICSEWRDVLVRAFSSIYLPSLYFCDSS
jgi:hypothetical protein